MAENANLITEQLIENAGIKEGMRVLELGCGHGVVTSLLARAVGPSGSVVGVDQSENMLNMARRWADEEEVMNVRFVQADLTKPLPPELGPFDAAFARRVLMYLPKPVETLRDVFLLLKSGGVIACQESDATVPPARTAPLPVHDQVIRWMWRTVEREGGNLQMGFALPSVLAESGFTVESVKAEAIIQGQGMHYPLETIIRAMLPRIVEHGVATEAEIDVETLAQRLKEERSEHTVFISDMAFSVWGRKP